MHKGLWILNKMALSESATFMFLLYSDVFCNLLLNRHMATWNQFLLYNKELKKVDSVQNVNLRCYSPSETRRGKKNCLGLIFLSIPIMCCYSTSIITIIFFVFYDNTRVIGHLVALNSSQKLSSVEKKKKNHNTNSDHVMEMAPWIYLVKRLKRQTHVFPENIGPKMTYREEEIKQK